MKKILAFSVLLALCINNAFSQITFGGYFYSGIELDIPYGSDETWKVNHRDGKYGGTEFGLFGTVSRDRFGAKVDTAFQPLTDDPFKVNGAYAWVNFLNKQLVMSVGKINDASWVTTLENNYKFDDVTGLRLEYTTPIDGLRVGVAFDAGEYDTETFFKNLIFGGTYLHSLFNAVIAYDFGSNTQMLFGFNYTGLDAIGVSTLGIEMQVIEIALFEKFGVVSLDEKIAYDVNRNLTARLHLAQKFQGNSSRKHELAFTPGVTYRIIRNRLTAFFDMGISFPDNPRDYFDIFNMKIHPWIEYNLGNAGLLYFEFITNINDIRRPKPKADFTLGFGIDIRVF